MNDTTLAEFREALSDIRRMPGGAHGPTVKGAAGSVRREAVERVINYVLSEDFEACLAEIRAENEEA